MLSFFAFIITLLVLGIGAALLVGSGGLVFVLVFGDVLICAIMVYMIIRAVTKKKK